MRGDADSPARLDDSELLDVTKDPAGAHALRRALENISKAGNEVDGTLKEMAKDILAGRQGLREAMTVSAYVEPAAAQLQPIRERWAELSDNEREILAAEGERRLAEHQSLVDEEQREKNQPIGKSRGRHDAGSWSLY